METKVKAKERIKELNSEFHSPCSTHKHISPENSSENEQPLMNQEEEGENKDKALNDETCSFSQKDEIRREIKQERISFLINNFFVSFIYLLSCGVVGLALPVDLWEGSMHIIVFGMMYLFLRLLLFVNNTDRKRHNTRMKAFNAYLEECTTVEQHAYIENLLYIKQLRKEKAERRKKIEGALKVVRRQEKKLMENELQATGEEK